MKFDDIAPYFHLPIVEAAEKLDVCATVLKGICRRVGVQRWPHRKVSTESIGLQFFMRV